MPRQMHNRKVRDYRRLPRQIAVAYIILASLWILLSDMLAVWLSPDARTLSLVQTYKGWFFVLATGALLYFVLRMYTAKSYELMSRLIDTETRFRQFFDTVPDVLFSAQLPGFELRSATPAVNTLLGYTSEEICKQPKRWQELMLHPSEVLAEMHEQLDDKGSFTVDYQTHHRDGSTRWIRSRGKISSGTGLHDSVFGVMTDISEAKRTEAAAIEHCLRDRTTYLLSLPAFTLAVDALVSGAFKQGLLLSCACLGIDDFPELRDRLGERRTERLLHRLSDKLLSALRSNNIIGSGSNVLVAHSEGRFLFIMPERSVSAMTLLAERLLRELDFEIAKDAALPIAIRIGIASHPLPGEDAASFIDDAIDALDTAREDTHTRITLYNVLEREHLTEETVRLRKR
ncbi:hypothetical protein CAI21_04935 [Alkalilimnicola ehrlichii]|uniref:Uncharacterized protein n=1 Tax=Alkalilimnicola ehrlichii TaxID=351052 RepID=A0A3E0X1D7_9GAMM|nr:PAS domain S-box protein [Alkalilimnicola ehrlichii]RFA30424.1 hypothetical protein CAI21_04935 [Alkalilimnicola ehrlichii]RFA37977.1 hypothetical protein CAL65_06310 [Alkalilimnicola ehrlichii]